MAVNVTTDTNTVKVTSTTTNNIRIVDNRNNTTVSVSQPTTRVVKVAAIGPQGPSKDAFPYSGSAQITGSLGITGSLANGLLVRALGQYSHAEGAGTRASGIASHAEGQNTVASATATHAEGIGTIAAGDYQHVQGKYNLPSVVQAAFIIGNGSADDNRSNLVFAAGSQVQISGSLTVSENISASLFQGDGSDLYNLTSDRNWNYNKEYIVRKTEQLTFSGDYILTGSVLYIEGGTEIIEYSPNKYFKEEGTIYIGGNLLVKDSYIENNGKISVGGEVILIGDSQIAGTGTII